VPHFVRYVRKLYSSDALSSTSRHTCLVLDLLIYDWKVAYTGTSAGAGQTMYTASVRVLNVKYLVFQAQQQR
jgi:hypothetical protein